MQKYLDIVDIAKQFGVPSQLMFAALLQSQFNLNAIKDEGGDDCDRVFVRIPCEYDTGIEVVFVAHEGSGFSVVRYTQESSGKPNVLPDLYRYDEGEEGYVAKPRKVFTEEELARSSKADLMIG